MKKITFLLTALLVVCSVSLSAQSTVQVTRFEGQRITGLKAGGMFQVELRQGERGGVQIEINENLLPDLVCELDGQVLRIGIDRMDKKDWDRAQKKLVLKAVVTVSQLDYLSLSGMSSLTGEGDFTTDDKAEVNVSGMSKINNLLLKAAQISVRCSGMSHMSESTLRAKNSVSLSVSGMSHISGVDVYAASLDASVSGMSHVSVEGEVSALGRISSSGMSDFSRSGLTVQSK